MNPEFEKYVRKAHEEMDKALRGEESMFTPFGDAAARAYIDQHNRAVMVRDTQHAIIKYAEPMAQFLAEAARASSKALGHSYEHALAQWITVIEQRAKELLRGGTVKQQEALNAPFIEGES